MPTVTEVQYGDLTLAFTTEMTPVWNNKQSGGEHKINTYLPVAPEGYYPLGQVGVSSYTDDGNIAGLLVKAEVGSGKPLAHPKGYERIWQNKGMNGLTGACWRPIPPEGYVALGHMFAVTHDTPPSTSDIVCVRTDLVFPAAVGTFLYRTTGSDPNKKFSAYQVAVPAGASEEIEEGEILMAGLTFVGSKGQDIDPDEPALYVLRLPCKADYPATSTVPHLESYSRPPDYSAAVVDAVVTLPFTAVHDDENVDYTGAKPTVGWQVANTPFYQVRRWVRYFTMLWQDNSGSSAQQTAGPEEETVGVSEDATREFHLDTGIEVGQEAGVEAGVEEKTSVKFTISLGFSIARSYGVFAEKTNSYSLQVPARTAAALYIPSYVLRLYRDDGTEVGRGLDFKANGSTATSQYPPVETTTTTVAAAHVAEPGSAAPIAAVVPPPIAM